jgi:hypothetical protein
VKKEKENWSIVFILSHFISYHYLRANYILMLSYWKTYGSSVFFSYVLSVTPLSPKRTKFPEIFLFLIIFLFSKHYFKVSMYNTLKSLLQLLSRTYTVEYLHIINSSNFYHFLHSWNVLNEKRHQSFHFFISPRGNPIVRQDQANMLVSMCTYVSVHTGVHRHPLTYSI